MLKDLFSALYKIKLFSVRGLYAIMVSLYKQGVNLFAILDIAKRLYAHKQALIFEEESYTYERLYKESINLAYALKEKFKLSPGNKVAICCSNHASFIISLFASARLGMDVYLLNIRMSESQFNKLTDRCKFDFIIYDSSVDEFVVKAGYSDVCSLKAEKIPAFSILDKRNNLKRVSFNKIVVFTSGTTGVAAKVNRRVSFFTYFRPFLILFNRLNVSVYKSLYITTPVSHGFGLIALLISIVLGKEIYLTQYFKTEEACKIIKEKKIEAITLVPFMLKRMLEFNPQYLDSLQCVISGGAALSPSLVKMTQEKIGNKLYNLYGTSEGGVCILATPSDLVYSANTIGKPLPGVQIRLIDKSNNILSVGCEGHMQVKCKWSVEQDKWINTGDIAYKDKNGYYYIKGRIDDMIISGGINIYPSELEDVLLEHPLICNAVAISVDDGDFGKRFKVFVEMTGKAAVNETDLISWLSQYLPRYQMPKELYIINEIPLNPAGKPDKKKLEIL